MKHPSRQKSPAVTEVMASQSDKRNLKMKRHESHIVEKPKAGI